MESVEQVQNALVNESTGECVNRIPTLKDAEFLVALQENNSVNYFGILTLGSGTVAKLYYNGSEIIEVSENSQIIEIWNKIEFFDNEGNVNASPKALFRGYILNSVTS